MHASAQGWADPVRLPVGHAEHEIGLESGPNIECVGPEALTSTTDGRIAILDAINHKIVVLEGDKVTDLPLSIEIPAPQDLMAVEAGYVVAGANGDVVLIDTKGSQIDHVTLPHNPENGSVRLKANPTRGLSLQSLDGTLIAIPFGSENYGGLSEPGIVVPSGYVGNSISATEFKLTNTSITGPLSTLSIKAPTRVVDARVLWQDKDGALVAVQQSQRLPVEASFVRLVKIDSKGAVLAEAYVPANAYSCGTDRPFVRVSTGNVATLNFRSDGGVILENLVFRAPSDHAPAEALQSATDATLIAEHDDTLKALERLNGTNDAAAIALSTTTRSEILKRARAALAVEWKLAPANFSHLDIDNECSPPTKIWRRPQRLENKINLVVKAVPYRWGGYLNTLTRFNSSLDKGLLAGNVCTCRTANCVNPQTTGFDCSGFVSYAWNSGNYFTTSSLPRKNVSTMIEWSSLKPGDIVNKYQSHVRLVEKVSQSESRILITVIESTTLPRCGGVCRSTYDQEKLKREGYKPFRRTSLADE